jgi:hypothetical protein
MDSERKDPLKRVTYFSRQRFRRLCHGLVALTALALSTPAMAGDQAPFQGTFTGSSTLVSMTVDFPIIHQTNTQPGLATHLGRFTWTGSIVADISPFFMPGTGNVYATGTSTWTAANGDQIFTSEAAELIAPAFTDEIEQHTVLGGTGRFAGETGSFTVTRSGDVGTIDGTISAPGSNE